MIPSTAIASLGSEFDAFLYASIDEDNNGMPLSVLSALARLEVDPWEEAARLTRLPKEAAVRQLISLLDAVPHRSSAREDSAKIAARLIPLLPRRPGADLSALNTLPVVALEHPAIVVLILLVVVIFMLLITLVQKLFG